ncbi:Fur family transcriptional regulator [Bacteroides sp. 224]|uniref:Fur family transcriptional regulator n=1 Tax=Bacteroides sp. 224 TaxID=2302936 RepID=UPI0013D3EF33|nr:transcriptional repressor [Bacteroides sp. 224]NDV66873.1 transcriptional repressor [Bacteroides sp. 224]
MKELEDKLIARDIKPTAVRLLIFKAMVNYPQAFSLSDLEIELGTVDKSTLFRTITLFHDHLLIHSIDDGSGSMKYSVCSDHCMCSIGELHVHFNCSRCHKTFCLESISIPTVQLPDNFLLESVNFVMKGLCDQCSGGTK